MQNNHYYGMPYQYKKKERICLDDILTALALISMVFSVGYMIGIAGGVETDSLTIMQAAKRFVAALIVLAIDVIIFSKVEKDDKSEFDRL